MVMNPINPAEAEIPLAEWASHFVALVARGESLGDYGEDAYTRANLKAGRLAKGINAQGGIEPWDEETLLAVQEGYKALRDLVDVLRKGGKDSPLRKINALARVIVR